MGPRHPREGLLLATIFLLNGIEFLQAGMLAFGATPILGEIGASPEEYTLVTAAYAVVAIGAIGHMGWFVERVGWRAFVQASIALFVAGAALCATSSSLPQFLAGRIVMGLGGAAFMTTARLLINLMPPSPRRFIGIKTFASALAIGNGSGPWVAAQVIGADRWPLLFVLLAGLALAAALLATLCLPTEPAPADARSGSYPLPLALLLAGCFASLYGLQRAQYDFYGSALPLVAGLALGAAAVTYFARQQSGQARPLLVVARLAQPRYLAGLAIFTLCYMVLGGNNYVLPQFVQRALGQPWEVAGAVQSAGLLAALPAFWVMASIIPRDPSPRKFYVAGFAALATFGVLLSNLNAGAHVWTQVLPAVACYGAFIILVMATTALHAFAGLQQDAQAFAHGQQVKNMLAQFGLAAGTALAALSMQGRSADHYAVLNNRMHMGDPVFAGLVDQLTGIFTPELGLQAGQAAVAQLAQLLAQQATLLASVDYFRYVAVLAVAGAVVMVWQKVLR